MSISIRRLALRLSAVWAILLALSLGSRWLAYDPVARAHHINIRHGIAERLDHDAEGTLPAWYQSACLLVCALLVGAVAGKRRMERQPYAGRWSLLAWFFLVASADEVAALHETLGHTIASRLGHTSIGVYAWLAAGAPLFGAVVAACWKPIAELPERTRRDIALAVILFATGAMGVEVIEAWLDPLFGTMTFSLIAAVEESLEMAGIVVFMRALLAHGRDTGALRDLTITD